MTREEFIKEYAAASGISADFATLGFIEQGGHYLLAMPCGCDDRLCKGWGMVNPDSLDTHLRLYAPDKLSYAYREAIGEV